LLEDITQVGVFGRYILEKMNCFCLGAFLFVLVVSVKSTNGIKCWVGESGLIAQGNPEASPKAEVDCNKEGKEEFTEDAKSLKPGAPDIDDLSANACLSLTLNYKGQEGTVHACWHTSLHNVTKKASAIGCGNVKARVLVGSELEKLEGTKEEKEAFLEEDVHSCVCTEDLCNSGGDSNNSGDDKTNGAVGGQAGGGKGHGHGRGHGKGNGAVSLTPTQFMIIPIAVSLVSYAISK